MKVEFFDKGGRPKCSPDPAYPNGMDVDLSKGASLTCTAHIECPAPCMGLAVIACEKCGQRIALTVASRPDDPRSVKLACKMPLQ